MTDERRGKTCLCEYRASVWTLSNLYSCRAKDPSQGNNRVWLSVWRMFTGSAHACARYHVGKVVLQGTNSTFLEPVYNWHESLSCGDIAAYLSIKDSDIVSLLLYYTIFPHRLADNVKVSTMTAVIVLDVLILAAAIHCVRRELPIDVGLAMARLEVHAPPPSMVNYRIRRHHPASLHKAPPGFKVIDAWR